MKPDTETEATLRASNLSQERAILTRSMKQENPAFYHSDKSQEGLILDYLKQGYSLTPMGALKLFGSLRLSGRIYQLRKEGWDIRRDMVSGERGKRWARYYLVGE